MPTILTTKGLTKDYGGERGAIGIDLSIKTGEIVGFLGPNGAGKTTTLKLITQQINDQSGSVYIFDKEIRTDEDYALVADKIGFMSADGGLYESLTPRKVFHLAAKLYCLDIGETNLDIAKYATEFKLELDRPIEQLSFGNKRKVSLIQAILHKPQLLILDEPTSGLDPLIQKQTLKVLRAVKEYGGAVLLSSHVLAEVEAVCDRVIIIKDSRIVFAGNTHEVLQRAYRKLRVINPSKELRAKLVKLEGVDQVSQPNGELTAFVDHPKEVLDLLVKSGHYEFYIERATLEEAFMAFY